MIVLSREFEYGYRYRVHGGQNEKQFVYSYYDRRRHVQKVSRCAVPARAADSTYVRRAHEYSTGN